MMTKVRNELFQDENAIINHYQSQSGNDNQETVLCVPSLRDNF